MVPNRWLIISIDTICLFALAAGMAAVLGVGMLSLAGGILNSTEYIEKPLLFGLIGVAIVAAFTISAASVLLKGIRILSGINVTIFISFACSYLLQA